MIVLQERNCLRYAMMKGHLKLVELLLAYAADELDFDDKASICPARVQSLHLHALSLPLCQLYLMTRLLTSIIKHSWFV